MNQKVLLIGTVIFSFLILVGSYFLIFGGKPSSIKIVSYDLNDKKRPKAELKNNFSDMGKIKVSSEKAAEFTIKNVGQKPLQLFNISSSCGCTVASVIIDGKESEEFGMHSQSNYVGEVVPGKQATIRVTYRPYVMPVYGPVEREVYVSTNNPEKEKLVFKVRAFVK
ncbi:MAG: DUF1573 domain-containing protein [Microgenomates group bacterium]